MDQLAGSDIRWCFLDNYLSDQGDLCARNLEEKGRSATEKNQQ
jgi:hypothetical protein